MMSEKQLPMYLDMGINLETNCQKIEFHLIRTAVFHKIKRTDLVTHVRSDGRKFDKKTVDHLTLWSQDRN